ncbi:universal stress protein [Aporhodopirellula aestuarii]|uniref:Universal stress protein n=1 Tax=Aporhodopirellula aestuarii TaxID=2950107 RepID=A0ABT0TZK8_9BACT|nr:universal stress protein [Aporhodopirellula aestuarii]MCM2369819.1 universal stress protein [Aporhodopirellula aestuarii]
MNHSLKIKRLLVGVDGSPYGHVAVELGIRMAKEYSCQLVGIDVIDEDETVLANYGVPDEVAVAERKAEVERLRQRAVQSLDWFEQRCQDADVQAIRCKRSGNAAAQILLESQRSDLVVLGRETHFEAESHADSTVDIVLRTTARPVVTVPLSLPVEKNVIVAYDGSRSASQALFAFVALGLGRNRKIHVVSVRSDVDEATAVLSPAFDYLTMHGLESEMHSYSSSEDVDKLLLNLAAEFDAGLLVAGACGHSRFREFLFGSVTKKLIRDSHVPVFLFH